MARRIESHLLAGPAGPLESLLEQPEDRDPIRLALVCHPHPLFGGTMHNKVVYRMARALRRAGAAVLRFNFRGVGSSGGTHAGGKGEVEDARAALDWLRNRYPGVPFLLSGFSFGSRVILKLGCGLGTPEALIAAGYPAKFGPQAFLAGCTLPKFFVHSTHDEHGSPAEMEKALAEMAAPRELYWVEARDHFFAGALDVFEDTIYEVGSL